MGDTVRTEVTYTTSTGSTAGVNPGTVYWHKKTPDGSVTTDSLAGTSTTTGSVHLKRQSGTGTSGLFFADILTTSSGLYQYRHFSSGVVTQALEGWFSVRPLRVSTS